MEVVHRLGVVLCVVVLIAWLVGEAAARRRERGLRRRVRIVCVVAEARSGRRSLGVPVVVRRWVPVVGAVSAGYVCVGGVAGVVVGVLVGVGVWRWRREREASAGAGAGVGPGPGVSVEPGPGSGAGTGAGVAGGMSVRGRAEAERQLPLLADLLAACLAAGAEPIGAARAIGESVGGPVGRAMARGAAQVRLGGEPGAAWRELAGMSGAGTLVRLLERAGESGAPAAEPVARFAAECRAERGRRATAVARRAAVLITAPVGLCFLPAFLAIGVVPVVIGLGEGVLGGR
ncbi:type II secretion system F family protein [Streptomyces sp. NPDC046939]|uniref:type II secretion system F family protein n=1 Tax=Streptomyces sp. NPDC046939 TaxID=3155376 RepID=UPI00340384BD